MAFELNRPMTQSRFDAEARVVVRNLKFTDEELARIEKILAGNP